MNSIWQTEEYRNLIARVRASTSNYEPVASAIQLDGSATDETLVLQGGYQYPAITFGGLPLNHVFDTLYNTRTHFKYVTTIGATTYTLDDSSIKQLTYTEKSVSGSQFSFGDFIGRLADFTLYDTDGTYDTVSFEGASGHLYFGVEKVDTSIFWIDYGTFVVDDCKRTAATIWFALKDKRYLFNATMATISTNKTLYQMAQEVCSQAGVTLGTASADLPNASITITNTTALQNKTLSQLVSAIAQATGTYAIIGKDDKLYFRWYEEVSPVCAIPANLVNASMTVADYEVSVTGLTWLDFNGASYSSGTSTYAIKVAGNPFEFANYNTVLSGIATNVIGTSYTPISLQYVGNPALEIGDIVIASDKHGNTYSLPITSISIRNLMSQSIKSTGESHISNASNTTSASTTIETAKNEAIAFAKFQEIVADRITSGKIQSNDTNTYFDLDNDKIATENYITTTRGTGIQRTTYSDGKILSERFTPMVSGTGTIDETAKLAEMYLKDLDGTPSYRLLNIEANYTVDASGAVVDKNVYIGNATAATNGNTDTAFVMRFGKNELSMSSSGVELVFFDTTGSTYSYLGIDATGIYKRIDGGTKTYL